MLLRAKETFLLGIVGADDDAALQLSFLRQQLAGYLQDA